MGAANGWLIVLAAVLGFVLTAAFMVARVKREVPVSAKSTLAGGAAVAAKPTATPTATPAKAAAAAPETQPASEPEPYGAGSVRLAVASADGPSGYTVKGNEDSMLYHSSESPSYRQTIAEVWFLDVESAEAAGFNRWDSGKSQRDKK
ncbi:hypothetical protein [Mycolicibacterium sp. YH-1]|uniref:channel accessory protein ArfC, sunset domain variant n=1 Tax=Mycolicibacterium sp. YH-1 TaxID=2908837 RepID=UPI001F4BD983|nr:hypothetical protein [Mycolicibacterium sp. YH-1]UNB53748.1 hypothetical protein L0M16_05175 [Mycolicibacterium sp. YH-1]